MANFRIQAVVGATTQPFRRAVGGLKSFVKRAFSGIGGVLAGVFSVGLVKGLFNEFDRLAKLSRQLRLPAATVQKFSVAAQLGGTNVEAFSKGLLQAERNAIKAEQGLVTYQRAFEDLGIETGSFLDLDIEGKLIALADAYSEADDKGAAVAALQETLGRSGRELIPTLEQGGEAVKGLLDSISTLDEAQFDQIEAVNDQITLLTNNLKTGLIPVILSGISTVGALAQSLTLGASVIFNFGRESARAAGNFGVFLLSLGRVDDAFGKVDFDGAGESVRRDVQQIGSFFDKLTGGLDDVANKARNAEAALKNVKEIQERIASQGDLVALRAENALEIDRARAAAEGFNKELEFLEDNLAAVNQRIDGLGTIGGDEERNDSILAATKERFDLEKQIREVRAQAQEQEANQREGLASLANERKILELREAGRSKEADALDRQAQAVSDARQFLEGIGVAFEGANAEAAVAEFEEIAAIQDRISKRAEQRSSAVTDSFRSIGGNDPIGVALSGPFDKQVEAQKETTRAVEQQTADMKERNDELIRAFGNITATVEFARLS